MEILKHLGIDLENDSVKKVIKKLSEQGLGRVSATALDEDGQPEALFLMVTEKEAIPFIEAALELYVEEKEAKEEAYNDFDELDV